MSRCRHTSEDLCVKSGYQWYGQVIPSHRYCVDMITCPRHIILYLVHNNKFSFARRPIVTCLFCHKNDPTEAMLQMIITAAIYKRICNDRTLMDVHSVLQWMTNGIRVNSCTDILLSPFVMNCPDHAYIKHGVLSYWPSQFLCRIQYIPRNMHTVTALLCFVVVIHWLIFPFPSGLLHWHCGNLTIVPVPAKQPWWIWINTSCEFIMNDCITTTKQSTTKPCAYFFGYTVVKLNLLILMGVLASNFLHLLLYIHSRICRWYFSKVNRYVYGQHLIQLAISTSPIAEFSGYHALYVIDMCVSWSHNTSVPFY